MTKKERFEKELKILTEGMVEGSPEYMEQVLWLHNKRKREVTKNDNKKKAV